MTQHRARLSWSGRTLRGERTFLCEAWHLQRLGVPVEPGRVRRAEGIGLIYDLWTCRVAGENTVGHLGSVCELPCEPVRGIMGWTIQNRWVCQEAAWENQCWRINFIENFRPGRELREYSVWIILVTVCRKTQKQEGSWESVWGNTDMRQ